MNKPDQKTGKTPVTQDTATQDEVDQFLSRVRESPPPVPRGDGRGRLIFAIDATASRQPTWDQAAQLQADMFTQTRGIGALDVQLVYYRGYHECRASPFVNSSATLLRLMQKIRCEAGTTQITRVLEHISAECRRQPVQAAVFIGDCVEEAPDRLYELAGRLRLLNTPVFLFQEGRRRDAATVFGEIARLSGGAHCRFDAGAARQLGELLNAVAAYATGGREALQRLLNDDHAGARQLLRALPDSL
ncbi:VWA domain-containing protein [Granulosicoccaceae sp. 1_MG-2023]|nr:VWA domain-containing protein [Granulosicoccaceae sp. 1_MG-2023]